MIKKLELKYRHTGCSRCNFQGCVWLREKHGETLGHLLWTITFGIRKIKDRFKLFIKSFSALDYSKIEDVEVDDIDTRDFPDFCDAYISSATYKGRDMTEDELEILNQDRDFVYEAVQERLY